MLFVLFSHKQYQLISPRILVISYFRLDPNNMTYKTKTLRGFALRPPPMLKLGNVF